MKQLTVEQLMLIDKHLKGLWLSNPEFMAEIKDHYICGMEIHLSNGVSWHEALRLIDIELGGRSSLLKAEENYVNSRHKLAWWKVWQCFKQYFIGIPQLFLTIICIALFYGVAQTYPADYLQWLLPKITQTSLALGFVIVFYVWYKTGWQTFILPKHDAKIFVVWSCSVSISQLLDVSATLLRHLDNPMYAAIGIATLLVIKWAVVLQLLWEIDWQKAKLSLHTQQ